MTRMLQLAALATSLLLQALVYAAPLEMARPEDVGMSSLRLANVKDQFQRLLDKNRIGWIPDTGVKAWQGRAVRKPRLRKRRAKNPRDRGNPVSYLLDDKTRRWRSHDDALRGWTVFAR